MNVNQTVGEFVSDKLDRKPRLLDLFCGAGGCAAGYVRAGFEVVGVDIKPQKNYLKSGASEFIQADALAFLRALVFGAPSYTYCQNTPRGVVCWKLEHFNAIHASPPCQAYTSMRTMPNHSPDHPRMIEDARGLLNSSKLPWIIENVPQAPLRVGAPHLFFGETGIVLCGSSFGLATDKYKLRRHRLFESNVWIKPVPCAHGEKEVIGFYGDHARTRTRINGHHSRGRDVTKNADKLALVDALMGINWMTWNEAKEAIPPAYTEFIGKQLLAHVTV